MTQLSPAAQKVQAAFWEGIQHIENVDELNLAAALRAVSARMMDLIGDIYHPKYLEGVEASSDLLDQIATELEAL
jgi:hypothetical protein